MVDELIFIVDDEDDECLNVLKKICLDYTHLSILIVISPQGDLARGFTEAIARSKNNILGVLPVDDFLPLFYLDNLIKPILCNGVDFVSATRYRNGGKRYGDLNSFAVISFLVNKIVKYRTLGKISDFTTGIKFWRKDAFEKFSFIPGRGWSNIVNLGLYAFEMRLKFEEIAIKSLDRPFDTKEKQGLQSSLKMLQFYFVNFIKIIK